MIPNPLIPALPFAVAIAMQLIAGLSRAFVGVSTTQYLRTLEQTTYPVDVPGAPEGQGLAPIKGADLLPAEYEHKALSHLFARQGEVAIAFASIPVMILPLVTSNTLQGPTASISILICLVASLGLGLWLLKLPIRRYGKLRERRIFQLGVIVPVLLGINVILGVGVVVVPLMHNGVPGQSSTPSPVPTPNSTLTPTLSPMPISTPTP